MDRAVPAKRKKNARTDKTCLGKNVRMAENYLFSQPAVEREASVL
jgi:hypothetical protein